ncbi:Abortive infection protein (plasmid) [Methanohalobium evestigatum Z-7303]|uniref:Abortive infection protein n=1 Tax=Methanohalobium evestigatum (strain ATCC BAA-1072 / DSM 3721 / NBRC 107634 / OCM 161 / Z-7303) TaxID=644295 RepID=D7EC10_METEZ|nr:type II CAAX endopeptidase family protein [Methanohalobium evestigatum]ADI75132.1 Abortive infection protein [Methanohalobium evestigatum Z-7303]
MEPNQNDVQTVNSKNKTSAYFNYGFKNKDVGYISIPILMIVLAESMLYMQKQSFAIGLHLIILIGLVLSTVWIQEKHINNIFQAMTLLPILRLVNLSMPSFFEMTINSYVFIYVPLMLPIYLITTNQDFTIEQIGLKARPSFIYAPLAVIVGLAIAEGEYFVISAPYLIPNTSLMNILELSIVMIFFVGLVEELIFRSILQTRLENSFGLLPGLLITSLLFGMMHSIYGNVYEIFFTSLAGLVIGYMFQKTRSLPVVAITHGTVNIFLFGLIPHMGPTFGLI